MGCGASFGSGVTAGTSSNASSKVVPDKVRTEIVDSTPESSNDDAATLDTPKSKAASFRRKSIEQSELMNSQSGQSMDYLTMANILEFNKEMDCESCASSVRSGSQHGSQPGSLVYEPKASTPAATAETTAS
jgi:hypothetical protein